MTTPGDLYQAGLGLLRNRQHRLAAELAGEALQEYPHHGDLWELLGVARFHGNDPHGAIAALETASLHQPLNAGSRYCLAGAYAAGGFAELAVFVYRLILGDPAAPVWLLLRVASRLGQLRAFAEALEVCQVLAHRDPERHEAHFGQAFYLRRLGASTASILAAACRAHELAPENSLYRVVLATLHQELGQTDDAWDLLRNLRPDAVTCCHSLRRMIDIFRAACDGERLAACQNRLHNLGSRPPHGD